MSDKLHRLHKLHLIVPVAALPAGEAVPHLPELRALLAGMAPAGRIECGDEDPATPFELALAQAYGLPGEPGYIPWAAFETGTVGVPCAWIKLCHWQVGTSHVMLAPPEDLALDAETSASLLAAMAPYFSEDGIQLQPWQPNGNRPGVWLATGEPLRHLRTVSMERMSGARLTPAVLDGAPAIRRLQNEMQMLLYTHPVSDARAQRGLQPVNSFWISGAGVLDQPVPAAAVPVQICRAADGDSFNTLLAVLRGGGDARLTLCGEHAAQSFVPAHTGFGGFTGFIGKLKSALGLQSAWNGWDAL